MVLTALPQLLAHQVELTFRMAVESRIVFGMALDPLPIYERLGSADINGVIADGNLAGLPSGIAEMFRPIVKVVDLHASSSRDLGSALSGRGQSQDEKIPIIGDLAV